jgi:metal-responsive CopG/Arc/MetJ family transcriptional regulator
MMVKARSASPLVRVNFIVDSSTLAKFDQAIDRRCRTFKPTRSEAIRIAMREFIAAKWKGQ